MEPEGESIFSLSKGELDELHCEVGQHGFNFARDGSRI
jgi:hypothetical protein